MCSGHGGQIFENSTVIETGILQLYDDSRVRISWEVITFRSIYICEDLYEYK